MSKALYSGGSYKSRAWFLKKLGFESYAVYLKSPLWSKLRCRVFELKGRACYLCGRYATQAHHTRYHEADLLGRKLKYIHPICAKCHESVEFLNGEKTDLKTAKRLFNRKRRKILKSLRPATESEYATIFGYLRK